jgi:hypothetical protein
MRIRPVRRGSLAYRDPSNGARKPLPADFPMSNVLDGEAGHSRKAGREALGFHRHLQLS